MMKVKLSKRECVENPAAADFMMEIEGTIISKNVLIIDNQTTMQDVLDALTKKAVHELEQRMQDIINEALSTTIKQL